MKNQLAVSDLSEATPLVEAAAGQPSSPRLQSVRPTPLRWLVLLFFFLFGYSNQMQYVAYSTIVRETENYWGVSATAVNFLAAVVPLVFAIGVFPGASVYVNHGLRAGALVGNFLNFVGGLVRIVGVIFLQHYWVIFVAQLFIAGGQVFLLGVPPLVATLWFPTKERTVATAIGTFAGFTGMATGMFYSPRMIEGASDPKRAFALCFAIQVVLALIAFVGTVAVIGDKPEGGYVASPTSRTPNWQKATPQQPLRMCAILKELVANRNFVLLAICFGATLGQMVALLTVLSQMLEPFGIVERQAGIMIFIGFMLGAVCCGLVGAYIDRRREYKRPIQCIYFISMVLIALFVVFMHTLTNEQFLVPCYLAMIGADMAMLPIFAAAFEFSVELSFPLPENVSGSFLMISLSAGALICTIVFSAILGNKPDKTEATILLCIVIGVLFIALLVITFGLSEDLRRLKAEKEQAALDDAAPRSRSKATARHSCHNDNRCASIVY